MSKNFLVYNETGGKEQKFIKVFSKREKAIQYCKDLCVKHHLRNSGFLQNFQLYGLRVDSLSTQRNLLAIFGDKVSHQIFKRVNGTTIDIGSNITGINIKDATDNELQSFMNIARRYGPFVIEEINI